MLGNDRTAIDADQVSSGGALAPLGAADMRLLAHIGELRPSGRRRLHGFEYIGRNAYHVASVTRLRQPLLVDGVASHAVEQIRAASIRTDFELLSFVVMPDHVHVLLVGRSDDSDLVRFVQRFKQQTGYAYKKATQEALWQSSYYDRIVRQDEDVAAMARYIAQNPERAGLIPPGAPWPYAGGVLVEEAPVVQRRPSGAKAPPLLVPSPKPAPASAQHTGGTP
jgi:REP element-mobilizing transposase RayT